jgi:hypothetical protein
MTHMASPTPLYGEKEDGRGKHMHVPISDFRKQSFLDWLCTPVKEREPKTMEQLADQLGLTRRTLTNWKDDKEFLEAWEKRYLKTIGDPSRKQTIMDVLYRTATDPDDPKHVQAAKQYFEIEGSVKPQKVQVEMSRPAKELSDDELDAILADKIASEKNQRVS